MEHRLLGRTGVRVSAPNLEEAVAGMPLLGCEDDPKKIRVAKESIQSEIEEVLIDTDAKGVIIKADSLGSVEAVLKLFGEKNVKVRKASIGDISKKDVLDAESNYEGDPLLSAIIAFNVSTYLGMKWVSKKYRGGISFEDIFGGIGLIILVLPFFGGNYFLLSLFSNCLRIE
jgi:translation initiation factor 5B